MTVRSNSGGMGTSELDMNEEGEKEEEEGGKGGKRRKRRRRELSNELIEQALRIR